MNSMNGSLASMVMAGFEGIELPSVITERFDILELLAENELGETYLLSDITRGGKYVLKSFKHANQTASESELIAGLSHKGLPKFEPEIWQDSTVYTLREYIDGHSLEEYLAERTALSENEAIKIISELCEIVAVLHSQSSPIIHRDIKPSNIVISSKSIKLIDFGISRKYDKDLKKDTVVFVTPEYAPPEQYGYAQTDVRTDIYSIGIVLRRMLTGTTSHEAVISNMSLHKIIQKCTALDPNNRYQSINVLINALKNIKKPRKNFVLRAAMVLLCFTALTWGGFLYARHDTHIAEAETPEHRNYDPIINEPIRIISDEYVYSELELELEAASVTPEEARDYYFDAAPATLQHEKLLYYVSQPDCPGYYPYVFSLASMGTNTEVYNFVEPLVEAAVRRHLEIDINQPLTYGHLEAITVIRIYGMYPSHLTTELMYNPNEYVLQEGNMLWLDDFKAMPNLLFLELVKQPIVDLSPLVYNQNLIHLSLERTYVTDLTPLLQLPNLRDLDLNASIITDWSTIEKMRNLQTLRITASNINVYSIAEIGDITLLNALDLSRNSSLICLEGLDNRTRLSHLDIRNTGVRDFSFLNDPNVAPRLIHLLISTDMERYLYTLMRDNFKVITCDYF